MHPSRMTFRMSKDRAGSSKETGGSPSLSRAGSDSGSPSDLPTPCDFDSWITSDFLLGHAGRTRASSWDDSDEEPSPKPEDGSRSRRIYSGGTKKSSESVADEIDELKRQLFQTLEETSKESDGRPNDRRQSPARIRRRTRSSSSSSPVLEETDEPDEEKGFRNETENKIMELDPKFYLNNFFTELRSRRISLFDSETTEEVAAPALADPNDEGFCRTTRKLSQILEVDEARRDAERSLEEEVAGGRKGETPKEERKEYKSLSFEFLEGGCEKHGEGSLSERCHHILRQVDQGGIFLTAKSAKTQLGSSRWRSGNHIQRNLGFFSSLKPDVPATEKFGSKESPKFELSLGRESGRSWVADGAKASGNEESRLTSSEESGSETEGSKSPNAIRSRSRTSKIDRLAIPRITPRTDRTTQTTDRTPSVKTRSEERLASEEDPSPAREAFSPPRPPEPRNCGGNDSEDECQEKKKSHRCSSRSEPQEKNSSRTSPEARNNSRSREGHDGYRKSLETLDAESSSRSSVEAGKTLEAQNSSRKSLNAGSSSRSLKYSSDGPATERSLEELEDASGRSKTSSGRNSNKRLSIINEASLEGIEIKNVRLEDEPSAVEAKSSTGEDGRWQDLIEALDSSRNAPGRQNFPGFPEPENSPRASASPPGEVAKEDSSALSWRSGEIDNKMQSPPKNPAKPRPDLKREDVIRNLDSVAEEPPREEPVKEEESTHHQTFFLDVSKETPFGIGEFGDVTCWNVGKSDATESEKPKDHGDGLQIPNAEWEPHVFFKEKKEKDFKTQRQLWTNLREDLRDAKQPQEDCAFPVPIALKASKSDHCLGAAPGIERGETNRKKKMETNTTSRVESDSESSEGTEDFQTVRVWRLTSSMSDLNARPGGDESLDASAAPFDQGKPRQDELESSNSGANKKTTAEAHNWLLLKNPQGGRRPRRLKFKARKGSSRELLPEDFSRGSIPGLKFRNSNCLQNFYRRVVRAFCVTSASSAATSN